MDEAFVKKVIAFKLSAANRLVDRLPKKMSDDLRDLGRIVRESLSEEQAQEQPPKTEPGNLNHIPID